MVLPQQCVRVVFVVVKEMSDEKKNGGEKKSHCGTALETEKKTAFAKNLVRIFV